MQLACDLCGDPRPQSCCFMLCCHCLDILGNFTFVNKVQQVHMQGFAASAHTQSCLLHTLGQVLRPALQPSYAPGPTWPLVQAPAHKLTALCLGWRLDCPGAERDRGRRGLISAVTRTPSGAWVWDGRARACTPEGVSRQAVGIATACPGSLTEAASWWRPAPHPLPIHGPSVPWHTGLKVLEGCPSEWIEEMCPWEAGLSLLGAHPGLSAVGGMAAGRRGILATIRSKHMR